jgi:indolepyruvate ferredoxin oxidoreductase alpha subunit
MLGNEAIARGAFEAGVTVASSYPGTPSTEINEYIRLYENIYVEWAPNEKVALEVVIGASYGGARAICSMKHVGLNVAADPLFSVSYTGVNGGLVIVVADDPGMYSSQNEQDSRYYAKASKIPIIEPSDSQECKDYVIKAFEISEKFDTPVLIRLTTRVAHSRTIVEKKEKKDYLLKDYAKDAKKYVLVPNNARLRRNLVEERINNLKEYSEVSDLNNIILNDNKIGIIVNGISYQYSKEVFEDASYLKLGMTFPLPDNKIIEFSKSVEKLYIIEELDGVIEEYIKNIGIEVKGKELISNIGELSSSKVKNAVLGIYDKKEESSDTNLISRPPIMCPGCPHRGAFYIFNKLNLNVSGDIGCYSLGTFKPFEAMDSCVCMGASIGMMHGLEKARGRDFAKKSIAVIGDSTFFHSGITGLIDIVYNKGISTVVILDNATTAMTGNQQNPVTGKTIRNESTIKIEIESICKGIGIGRVKIVDPFELDDFKRAIKEELEIKEPSVIISKRVCALKIKSENFVYVDKDKCIECKMCLKIGCPAIENLNNEISINENLCTGCNLCMKICKFSAIKEIKEYE